MIKSYLEKRRAEKYTRDFTRGFEWAMVEIFIAKTPPTVVNAKLFNAFDANGFEKGAAYALRVIDGLGEH